MQGNTERQRSGPVPVGRCARLAGEGGQAIARVPRVGDGALEVEAQQPRAEADVAAFGIDADEARAGERIVAPGGGVDEQRDAVVVGDVAAALGEVRDENDRRRIVVDGDEDERGMGPAARVAGDGGERAGGGAAQPPPRASAAGSGSLPRSVASVTDALRGGLAGANGSS